jgi:hypothetical protein
MAFDNHEIALRTRQLLTERSPAAVNITLPHIVSLIPVALELWSRESFKDPDKKNILTQTITLNLVAGVADLTNYINGTTSKILADDVKKAVIYTTINGVRVPFTWVGSQAQLNAQRLLGSSNPAVFFEDKDNFLRTRNTDGSLTSLGTASITFGVPVYPTSAATIPIQLQMDFIAFLAGLAAKEMATAGGAQ